MSYADDEAEARYYHDKADRLAAIANGEIEPVTEKEKAFFLSLKSPPPLEKPTTTEVTYVQCTGHP